MGNLCKLCGEELVENTCPNTHIFKKMCINCKFCNENMCCTNETNMEMMITKMKEVVGESYLIDDIKLSPATLKFPTKKCKNWELNDAVLAEIGASFV